MQDNTSASTTDGGGAPRRLAATVEVDGQWYGPDSDPADVAKIADKIRNPKAWAADGDTSNDEPAGVDGTGGGHRLARPVDVGGVTYGPGDYVPDHVARQIRNPKAWEGGQVPDLAAAPAGGSDQQVGGETGGGTGPSGDGGDTPPAGPDTPTGPDDRGPGAGAAARKTPARRAGSG